MSRWTAERHAAQDKRSFEQTVMMDETAFVGTFYFRERNW